jgi:hypothetical protein
MGHIGRPFVSLSIESVLRGAQDSFGGEAGFRTVSRGHHVAPDTLMRAVSAGLLVLVLCSTASATTMSQSGASGDQSPASPQSDVPFQLVSPEVIVVGHGPEAPDVPQRTSPTWLIPVVVLIPYAVVAPALRECVPAHVQGAPPVSTASAPPRFPSFPVDRSMSIGALYPPPAARSESVVIDCQPAAPHSRVPSYR